MSERDSSRPAYELLVPAVGAAIFASDEPVQPADLAKAFGELDTPEIERAIDELDRTLRKHATGLRLEKVAGGYRLATHPDVGRWLRQYFRQRHRTRLTPASLETLAIVAYRQPVTAPEIQAIRGKDSTASLKTLVDKKLVRLLGRKKVVGSPLLYGTSRQFLVHFGLDSLSDLPSIEDFEEIVGGLAAQGQELLLADREPLEIEPLGGALEADEAGEAPAERMSANEE